MLHSNYNLDSVTDSTNIIETLDLIRNSKPFPESKLPGSVVRQREIVAELEEEFENSAVSQVSSHSHTHTHTLFLLLYFSLPLSLFHTHTHTHTRTHTHTHTLSHILTLSLSHTHTHPLSLSLTHTHSNLSTLRQVKVKSS